MEGAVLKTLELINSFDYPLKAWEIHKWLFKRKGNLRDVEKALRRLLKKKKITQQNGYYFLSSRKGLLKKRLRKENEYKKSLKRISFLSKAYKLNPKIKLTACYGEFISPNCLVSDLEQFSFKKGKESALQILQIQLIWERGKYFREFLEEHSWAFEYFPNFMVKKAHV